jgi:hypothetical protein
MTTRNVIDLIGIALLAAFTLVMSAQAQRRNLSPADIKRMEEANEFLNRAEDACNYLLKKSGKADVAYMRCLNEYRDPPPRCDLACQLGIDDIGKNLPRGAGERVLGRGNLPVNDIIILPPKEFDHDYTGEMTIKRADAAGMREACHGISITGCSYRWNDERCVVYIANDDELNKHYLSYDAVFRHERAHCLGWHHADESKKRY